MSNSGKPATRKATSHYGLYTVEQPREIRHVICPVPGCKRRVALTLAGYLEWHANATGFTCDGVNMTPERAATLQIDGAGRLVGVDEMNKVQ